MSAKYEPLPRSFYQCDTHTVAKSLLGKLLVRRWRNRQLVGRITEVESYIGRNDAACHAARGRTKRTEVMFGDAGHAYVYLIYGMYDCLNIVTEPKDVPAAVLIRSLEPVAGLKWMQGARKTTNLHNVTTGPGKLTQALAITRMLNAEDLTSSRALFVAADGYQVRPRQIATSPRIGVHYAGEDSLLPWRYFLKDSPFVSGIRRNSRANLA